MTFEYFTLPTHWATALVNGDLTGFDDDDLKHIEEFTEDMVHQYGKCWCVDVGEDVNFIRHHDASVYGVLACDCSTYTFDITK